MKDGFILFYVKDNNLLPVRINDEQTKTLQDFIPVIFQEEKIYVIDNPIGKVIDKEIKETKNENVDKSKSTITTRKCKT